MDEGDYKGLNFLTAYYFEKGPLINFGGRSLEFKRLFIKNAQSKNPENFQILLIRILAMCWQVIQTNRSRYA